MTDKVWVPERWNRGLWDQAHWNGQLGFNAQLYAITVNGNATDLRHGYILTAATASIAVQGIPVICRSGRGLRAKLGEITLTGFPIGSFLEWHMPAETPLPPPWAWQTAGSWQIVVTGNQANLVPFFGAGELHFGIPVKIARRW